MAATIEQVTELARQIDRLRTDYATLSASHNALHQEANQLRAQVNDMRTGQNHGANGGSLIDPKTMVLEKFPGPNGGKIQFRDWNQGLKAYVRGIQPGVKTLLDQLESKRRRSC